MLHVLQHKGHHPTVGKQSLAKGPNSARNSRHILQVFLHTRIFSLLFPSAKSLKIWPITITFEHKTIHGGHCSPREMFPFGVKENNL